jgi:hypothetical protein
MTVRTRRLVLVGALLSAVVAFDPPRDAEACIHGMSQQVDPVPMAVAQAELLLDQGKPRAAVAKLKSVDATLIDRKPGAGPVSDRALRVIARAAARTGGSAPLGFANEPEGEGADGKRIDWAIDVMRELAKKQPGDAGISTDLAEVLAGTATQGREAERILTELEGADLIVSGHAYAALARLRSAGHPERPAFLSAARTALDKGRVQIDLSRCEQMTKDKAACSVADPREISASEPKPPVYAPPAKQPARSNSSLLGLLRT